MLGRLIGFNGDTRYDTAIRLYDQGQFEDAVAEFERILASSTGVSELVGRLSRFYMGESYANLGNGAMKRGNWDRACFCFGKAIEVHPHYADLHYHLAQARRGGGEDERALEALSSALAINPRFAKAHFTRGLIYYALGEREKGLDSLCEALDHEPAYRTQSFADGMLAHKRGDFDIAWNYFSTAAHTEVDDIQFHFRLGDDMYKRGLALQAIEEYNKALALNPDYADIHNHAGAAYSCVDDLPSAVTEFEKALAINPNFLEARLNLAIALCDQGRPSAARVEFLRALELEPDNLIALKGIDRCDEADRSELRLPVSAAA